MESRTLGNATQYEIMRNRIIKTLIEDINPRY